jgi:hypothetical protein
MEWQPIDKDTPHDGTMLLLACNRASHPEDRWVVSGSYERASKKTGVKKSGWYNQFLYEDASLTIHPTHWMYLPNPPEPVNHLAGE